MVKAQDRQNELLEEMLQQMNAAQRRPRLLLRICRRDWPPGNMLPDAAGDTAAAADKYLELARLDATRDDFHEPTPTPRVWRWAAWRAAT